MIYIYGPMTGIARYNFPAFFAEELRLRDAGEKGICNPARVDMELDRFDPDDPHPREMKHYAQRDIMQLMDCDKMSALPGWDDSKGARAEHAVGSWFSIHQIGASSFRGVSETCGQRDPEDSGVVGIRADQ